MPKNTPPRKEHNRVPRAPRVTTAVEPREAERIAKVIARAGLGSRREIEEWILAGRVAVNGEVLESPARTVTAQDSIVVDGKPLPDKERTRLFLYHKPKGVVTTNYDPEGRPTLFEILPPGLPRLISVGRLDLTTEGLILLTNDGGLSRILELPETGWLRRYRVRAKGEITQDKLDALIKGITVEGVHYGPIEAVLDRVQGANVWVTLALREGKNREVRNVLGSLGLEVNRLIRLSYGPFQLGEIPQGEVEEIRTRILADQLGPELTAAAGADFEGPVFDHGADDEEEAPAPRGPKARYAKPEHDEDRHRRRPIDTEPGTDKTVKAGILADRKGRKFLVQRVRSTEAPDPEADPRPARAPRLAERAAAARAAPRSAPSGDRPVRAPRERNDGERTFRKRPDGERPAPRADAERSFRPREDRPVSERAPREDRAPRGDRPDRPHSDRPVRARPTGDRPDRAPRGDRPTGDRPERSQRSDKPFIPRPSGGDRPDRERPTGDRPFRERTARPTGDRVVRDRPAGDHVVRDRPDGGRSFRPRPDSDRPVRSERPTGDRPDRAPRGERPIGDRPERPFRERSERPAQGTRTFTERPPRGDSESGERSFRPRTERTPRPDGDRPVRRERSDGDERPARAPRPEGGRPPRRSEGSSNRPYSGRVKSESSGRTRPSGGKPASKPFTGAEGAERRVRETKPGGKVFGAKNFADKPAGRSFDKPAGRPTGGKPAGRPAGGKSFGDKPGGRPTGGKPPRPSTRSGGKPSGGKPSGPPRGRSPRG